MEFTTTTNNVVYNFLVENVHFPQNIIKTHWNVIFCHSWPEEEFLIFERISDEAHDNILTSPIQSIHYIYPDILLLLYQLARQQAEWPRKTWISCECPRNLILRRVNKHVRTRKLQTKQMLCKKTEFSSIREWISLRRNLHHMSFLCVCAIHSRLLFPESILFGFLIVSYVLRAGAASKVTKLMKQTIFFLAKNNIGIDKVTLIVASFKVQMLFWFFHANEVRAVGKFGESNLWADKKSTKQHGTGRREKKIK